MLIRSRLLWVDLVSKRKKEFLLKSAFVCMFRFFGLSSFDTITTLILSHLASFLPFSKVIPEIFYNFAFIVCISVLHAWNVDAIVST